MSQIDLSQPIYLHFDQKKFWEISLLNGNKSSIRFGKLVKGVQVDETVEVKEKQHKDAESCLNYIIRVIEVKRIKGYQGSIQTVKKQINVQIVSNNANNNAGYGISINAPAQKNDNEEEEEQKSDPNTQCFLSLNNAWNSKFVILYLKQKTIEEYKGQINLKRTWEKQSTQLSSNKDAKQYFDERIEEYENQGYTRDDSQYNYQYKQCSDHLNISSQDSNTIGMNSNSTLSLPGKKKPTDNLNSRRLMDDSHSNISGLSNQSDLTDLSQVSGHDISFIDENSSMSLPTNSQIDNGSLGGRGQMEGGVLLAHAMPDEMDPTGWYGSEKMDGVRAIWTGSTFYSRNGNEFYPPPFFIENFPKCTLDGELFTKRDDFQRCVGIVKTQNQSKDPEKDDRWREVKYLVYDAPKLNKPFKDRIKALQEQIPKVRSKYIFVLPHVIIKDRDHLDEQLEKTLKNGGEGVMLRDPNSNYEKKRSKTLLKVKVFTDEEATVIGIERGEGRCAGMMGAIQCRMKNGVEFKIGSGFNDDQRRRPPKVGSIVTFKYQNLTKDGKPRFPIYLRNKVNE